MLCVLRCLWLMSGLVRDYKTLWLRENFCDLNQKSASAGLPVEKMNTRSDDDGTGSARASAHGVSVVDRGDTPSQRPVRSECGRKVTQNVPLREARLPPGWSLCKPSDEMILCLEEVSIDPDPPQRGKDLVISIDGCLREEIREGKLRFAVRYSSLSVLWSTVDLCRLITDQGWLPGCPIKAGPIRIRHTISIPKMVPSGPYSISATAFLPPSALQVTGEQPDLMRLPNPSERLIFCAEGKTVLDS